MLGRTISEAPLQKNGRPMRDKGLLLVRHAGRGGADDAGRESKDYLTAIKAVGGETDADDSAALGFHQAIRVASSFCAVTDATRIDKRPSSLRSGERGARNDGRADAAFGACDRTEDHHRRRGSASGAVETVRKTVSRRPRKGWGRFGLVVQAYSNFMAERARQGTGRFGMGQRQVVATATFTRACVRASRKSRAAIFFLNSPPTTPIPRRRSR